MEQEKYTGQAQGRDPARTQQVPGQSLSSQAAAPAWEKFQPSSLKHIAITKAIGILISNATEVFPTQSLVKNQCK